MNVIEREMQELKEIIENGRINLLPAERVAENILAAGYRNTFTSDTQKAYKDGYEKARKNAVKEFAEKCMDGVGYGSDERIIKNYLDEFMKEYEK